MKKVLIVDDNPDVRKIVSKLIQVSGYKALIAKNGMEGMGIVKDDKPDLIILDVVMPKESGVRMYHELKSDDDLKDIPVIMLSAIPKKSFLKSQKVLNEFRGKSVPEPYAYIEKPEEPEELVGLMREILE